MERQISLTDIAGVEHYSAHFARMGDSYILSHIKTPEGDADTANQPQVTNLNKPVRLNGLLLCVNNCGRLTLSINLETYDLEPGSIMTVSPGTLISYNSVEEPVDFYLLFVSTSFLSSINIDLQALNIQTLVERPQPVMKLNEREGIIIRKYMSILGLNADANNETSLFSKQIARSLISAIVYQLLKFIFFHIDPDHTEPGTSTSRPSGYVREFMKLLLHNYAVERSTAFYADKLCITPKYLSMIIKEATGRTASEWINNFIALEAKNMLRFSGKNIQQVAYALNFPSQSSFGKFFKRVTGQSPTEYQKS